MAPHRRGHQVVKKDEHRLEATRRAIQHEYLRALSMANFSFEAAVKEPRGIQARVVEIVNKTRYKEGLLTTNQKQVSEWCKRCRMNNWNVTEVKTNYATTSQNARKFFLPEQKRIRHEIKTKKMKSTEVTTVWSDKKNKLITISPTSARRYLKRKLGNLPDERRMIPARPKGMKVGGDTPHHDRCRLTEALWLKMKGQAYIDGMYHADESKIKFKERPNRQIDIEWTYLGEASETGWFEDQRHPGQINLYILQSKNGIEMYDIYHKNLGVQRYKTDILPKVGAIVEDDPDFTCYLHDNAWGGKKPTAELDHYIGENKWTQYMGRPCRQNHPTALTPVRKLPVKVAADVCRCEFPEGPIHAAYHPKFNLVEQTFDRINRKMILNKRADAVNGRMWPLRGPGKKKWWIAELKKAIKEVNDDKAWFKAQYDGFIKRCDEFITSNGKRLKKSKW